MTDSASAAPETTGFDGATEPQDFVIDYSAAITQLRGEVEGWHRVLHEVRGEVAQHAEGLNRMGQQVQWLAQQRAIGELNMERHTRATAFDLAIKALPASVAEGSTEKLLAGAEAILTWLKSGTN